jgi:proton glutamate symport protein
MLDSNKLIVKLGLTTIVYFFLLSVLHVIHLYSDLKIPDEILMITRWIFILLLVPYGITKRKLTTWIFISMVVGCEIGHDFPKMAVEFQLLSKIFLRMIKTVIAPLLFATLVVGIAGHSNLKKLGRLGWKSLLYFEIVSTIALFIGLAAINISQAGKGVSYNLPPSSPVEIQNVQKQTFSDVVLHIFPENIAKSVYEGQILQVVVFSILFAIATALIKERYKLSILNFCEALSETMFKFTNIIMYFAPFAVCGALAFSVGHMGIGILVNLGKLLFTLYMALTVLILVVFIPLMLFLKIPVTKFFKAISESVSIAFATTSSESALPRAMEAMEKFGVPRKIVAFVLPTGYSFNLDGTTLYLSLATVFVAQVAGIELSLGKQLIIVLTLMLTSKGVAGIPRASLAILLATASSFGLPLEPILIIFGIDELMDMARTAVNVTGNCLATVVIAKWEGEFSEMPIEAPELENV